MNDCIFCQIIHGQSPTQILKKWDDAIAIVPLNPVVPGHVLVVPREHVKDALENTEVTAAVMKRAAKSVSIW